MKITDTNKSHLKIKFIVLSFSLLFSTQLFSKSWLDKAATSLDIQGFVKTFEIEPQIKICNIDDIDDSLIGLKVHHQDLFLFTENVRDKGYVRLFDSYIKEKKKNGVMSEIGKILGKGTNTKKSGKTYINMFEIPFFSAIADSIGLDGYGCFHPKGKAFFYSTSVDPTAVDYIQYFQLLDAVSMYTLPGIFSMIIDCVAYEGYAKSNSWHSGAGLYFANTIDIFDHSFGCSGGVTLGAENQSNSQLVNGVMSSITELKIMARTGLVIQQSKNSLLNKGIDVECSQNPGPFIKTEFTPQMIEPVASKQFQVGQTPAEWAEFKNDHSTRGDTVVLWWVNKDFVSMSGKCSW